MRASLTEGVAGRSRRRAAPPVVTAALARSALAALALLATMRTASAQTCAAAPPIDAAGESTDALLTAAEALTSPLDRPRARALYLAVLSRDADDEEAAVGLARVDAADGCFALAERGLRGVLVRSPGNVAARATLADVLVRTGRLGAAEDVLDRGLHEAPFSPDLLARRGRVAMFRGDPATARLFLDEAGRVVPLDPEVEVARERAFVGQARIGQRVQVFPSGYDDTFTTDTSVMSRWHRLRFEGGGQVVARYGALRSTRSGELRTTVIDGRPWFGTFAHFDNGAWAGGTVGISAPALALPAWALTLSGFTPLTRVVSAQLVTAYWQYRDDRAVTIASPALGFAVADTLDLTARYWLTSVFAGTPRGDTAVKHVHSLGGRVGWRPAPRLSLGLDYTYGVQVERNPTATELAGLRSHIVSAIGLWSITPAVGVDLALSVERRLAHGPAPAVFGPAIEAGVFTRW